MTYELSDDARALATPQGINGSGMVAMRPEPAPGDAQGASLAPGDPKGSARPAEWRHRVTTDECEVVESC